VYGLGYITGLANLFFEKSCETKLDLTIASGRSSDSAYPGKRVIICGDHPAEDLLDHTREKSPAEKSGYEVSTTPSNTLAFTFGGTMYAPGQKVSLHTFPGFALADVESNPNLRAIGKGEDSVTTYGFRDMARQSYVFRAISEENKLRVACDALGQIFDEPIINHEAAAERRFVSDTRQIVRVEGQNLLIVDAPTAQGLSGALSEGTLKTSQLSLQTASPVGTLMWVSLDGKPADTSQRWQLKMVTIAANTGEKKEPHPAGQGVVKTALLAAGEGPVLTFGEASQKPTTITLAGAEIARIGLYNGSFEIVRDRRDYIVYCDTPGVQIALPALGKDVYVTSADGRRVELSQPVAYPKGAPFIVVRARTGPEA
jgi:hypothetical protein